jgi:hypothetical protein
MRIRNLTVPALLLLAACASTTEQTSGVERMYVINCGENHVKDVSHWTPGVNAGKAHVFSNHCYLVRHARGQKHTYEDSAYSPHLASSSLVCCYPSVGMLKPGAGVSWCGQRVVTALVRV